MSVPPIALLLVAVVSASSSGAVPPDTSDARSEALNLNQLGLTYEREGKYAEARHAFDDSISRLTHLEGENSRSLIQPLNNLANLLYESNQSSLAEGLVRRSIGILSSTGTPDWNTGEELALLAKMYLGERKLSLAQQSAEESLKILKETGHAEDFAASISWSVLGTLYDGQHDSGDAAESLNNALSIVLKKLRPGDYRIAEAKANLGLLYVSSGSPEKGEPLLEEAHASFRLNKLNSIFVRGFLVLWADIERKAGNADRATHLVEEAESLIASGPEASMSRYTVDANGLH